MAYGHSESIFSDMVQQTKAKPDMFLCWFSNWNRYLIHGLKPFAIYLCAWLVHVHLVLWGNRIVRWRVSQAIWCVRVGTIGIIQHVHSCLDAYFVLFCDMFADLTSSMNWICIWPFPIGVRRDCGMWSPWPLGQCESIVCSSDCQTWELEKIGWPHWPWWWLPRPWWGFENSNMHHSAQISFAT